MPRFLSSPAHSPRVAASRLPANGITTLDPFPADVVEIIFDCLEAVIPITLACLSKSCYDKIIPKIYRNVTIFKKNATKVFYGMCSDQTAELPYPYGGFIFSTRKAEAFKHTTRVAFQDIWAAEAVVMAAREYPTHEFGFMAKENSYPMLFPSVKYVLLGKDILRSLPDTAQDVNIAEQRRWETNHVMSADNVKKREWVEHHGNYYVTAGEFEDLLFRMVDPEIVCFDMMYVDSSKGNSYNGALVTDSLNLHPPKGRVVIHWFFYDPLDQRPLFGELEPSILISIVFHTSPPPHEPISDPEIAAAYKAFSELSPILQAKELALAVDKLIEEILMYGQLVGQDRLPGPEETQSCEIELCMPNAKVVRDIWKGTGTEVSETWVRFTTEWEKIIKFKDLEDMEPCGACGRK